MRPQPVEDPLPGGPVCPEVLHRRTGADQQGDQFRQTELRADGSGPLRSLQQPGELLRMASPDSCSAACASTPAAASAWADSFVPADCSITNRTQARNAPGGRQFGTSCAVTEYIAAQGRPYRLKRTETGRESSEFTYCDFDTANHVRPPADSEAVNPDDL